MIAAHDSAGRGTDEEVATSEAMSVVAPASSITSLWNMLFIGTSPPENHGRCVAITLKVLFLHCVGTGFRH